MPVIGHRAQHGIDVLASEELLEFVVLVAALERALLPIGRVLLLNLLPALPRFTASTSETATIWSCFWKLPRMSPKWPPPMLPMPIIPSVIRSLGGFQPSSPRAEAGTMYGAATAAAAPFRSARRVTLLR
jgi:hypothetical protein